MDTADSDRIKYLDCMRGVAVLLIFLHHLAYIPKPTLEYPDFLSIPVKHGGSAVIIFFILSSISLCLSTNLTKFNFYELKAYAIKRIFRIFPLYYLWLIIYSLASYFLKPSITIEYSDYILYFSGLFNLTSSTQTGMVWASWAIGVLIIFYILFPLLVFINKKGVSYKIIFIFSTLFFISIYYTKYRYLAGTWGIFTFLPILCLGFIFYNDILVQKNKYQFFRFILVGIIGCIFISFVISLKMEQLLFGFFYLLIIYFLSIAKINWLLSPFNFLSKISLSLYLNHPAVIYLCRPMYNLIYSKCNIGTSFCLCIILTLAILIPFSTLTYHIIEQCGYRFRKKLLHE